MRAFLSTAFLVACTTSSTPAPAPTSTGTTAAAVTTASPAGTAKVAQANAELGKPAPDFTLPDVDGKPTTLSQYKGKVVVLEWFNPNCPFVKRNHEKGPLKDMAARVQKDGIVWLSINSGAKGKQGNGVEASKAGIAKYGMQNAVLLDEDGKVGHAYGASHTPHMYVIDASGTLVYRGAIDNAPDGETDLAAPFVNYVEAALGSVAAGKPVAVPETKSYGCSVKYVD
jgi:peroxiredoxin